MCTGLLFLAKICAVMLSPLIDTARLKGSIMEWNTTGCISITLWVQCDFGTKDVKVE